MRLVQHQIIPGQILQFPRLVEYYKHVMPFRLQTWDYDPKWLCSPCTHVWLCFCLLILRVLYIPRPTKKLDWVSQPPSYRWFISPCFPTLIHVIRTMKCSTTSHFLSRGQGCSNPSWINYSNLLWGKNVFILHLLNLTPKRMGGGLGASLEEEEKFLEQRPKLSSQGSGSGAATDHVWQEGLRVRLLVPDPFWRAWLASLAVDCKVIPSGNQRKSPFRMGI